ncbi:MAG: hypothetical protein KatS3mg043_0323 [Rhodothermaceae bacterium]|nr:MAG: hypothetical protein KatS3mg043_0323 [Rhodothermaceae bacterium]
MWALIAPGGRTVQAQGFVYNVVYRPPEARYFVLETPHFEVIYEEGAGAEARETAARLEANLPAVQALVGARSRLRMPVVINRFNDRSNGYVTPLPFKQEIEAVSIKGAVLSPRYRSWIQTVAPHELVHAVHADFQEGFGVGEVVRWLSPDLSRTLNLTIPPGIAEGAAVLYESSLEEGRAGRLNHAFFTMVYRAALMSDRPWSLAQMLERSAYTFPFDRHYLGGAYLFRFLHEQGKTDFFPRATRLHYRFPLLGYGVNLWYGARTWPRSLRKALQDSLRAGEVRRVAALGPVTVPTRIAGARGVMHHRPRWLDAHTLVAYVFGYDVTAGLYRIDARTGRRTLLSVQALPEDRFFSFDADSSALLFARYEPDPLVPIRRVAEVFRLELATGRVTRLTRGGRVMTPAAAPDGGVWALRNEGQYNRWVRLTGPSSFEPVADWTRARFVSLHPSPDGKEVAVIVNLEGHQGLFRATLDAGGRVTLAPWVGFAGASVYDAAWSADGRYLLFTADRGGIANVYALEVRTGQVRRMTNARYGAMEPALSPDGRTLAFIHYEHERYDLVRIPFTFEAGQVVPPEATRFFDRVDWEAWLREPPAPSMPLAEPRPYRSLAHLRPRMLLPTFRLDAPADRPGDTRLGPGYGLMLHGTDPLQRWTFGAEGFFQKERVWGSLAVRTSLLPVYPMLRLFRRPETVRANVVDAEGQTVETVRLGREERGGDLTFSFPLTLESNVHRTSLLLSVQGGYRQERLFDRNGRYLTGFTGRYTVSPALSFVYRLRRNIRDLVPHQGLVLGGFAERDVAVEDGPARAAHVGQAHLYLPWLKSINGGLRLHATVLDQNRGGIFDLEAFMPRGHEDVFLGRGTFVKYGGEYVQPLWFIDNGLFLLPFYFKALYAFGFAETLHDVARPADRVSSVGAGLGLQFRFFYVLDLELRVAAAYRVEDRRWRVVYR